jgi:hypothetical protein
MLKAVEIDIFSQVVIVLAYCISTSCLLKPSTNFESLKMSRISDADQQSKCARFQEYMAMKVTRPFFTSRPKQ